MPSLQDKYQYDQISANLLTSNWRRLKIDRLMIYKSPNNMRISRQLLRFDILLVNQSLIYEGITNLIVL